MNKITIYKTDFLEFTVTEQEEDYELQFREYPDCLRGDLNVNYVMGEIGGITIQSNTYSVFDGRWELLLPGSNKSMDDEIVCFFKSKISKEFFPKLFDLLCEQYEKRGGKLPTQSELAKEIILEHKRVEEKLNKLCGMIEGANRKNHIPDGRKKVKNE